MLAIVQGLPRINVDSSHGKKEHAEAVSEVMYIQLPRDHDVARRRLVCFVFTIALNHMRIQYLKILTMEVVYNLL